MLYPCYLQIFPGERWLSDVLCWKWEKGVWKAGVLQHSPKGMYIVFFNFSLVNSGLVFWSVPVVKTLTLAIGIYTFLCVIELSSEILSMLRDIVNVGQWESLNAFCQGREKKEQATLESMKTQVNSQPLNEVLIGVVKLVSPWYDLCSGLGVKNQYLSIYLFVCLPTCPCLSVCLSRYIYLSVCPSVSPWLVDMTSAVD